MRWYPSPIETSTVYLKLACRVYEPTIGNGRRQTSLFTACEHPIALQLNRNPSSTTQLRVLRNHD